MVVSLRLGMFTIVLLGVCLLTSSAYGQSALENPQPNSNQSGISALTGWICNGQGPAIRFNGGAQVPVAYGTPRADTIPQCGDENNGFALLFNWNLLGAGTHLVELLNGGAVIASAQVTVATFGTEFLRGASGTLSGTIGGRNIVAQWSEASQNLIITGTGGQQLTDLNLLRGTWQFNYTIVSTFTATYRLDSVDTSQSFPILLGIDLQDNEDVGIARALDIDPDTTITRTFILLDPDLGICAVFLFDLTSPDSVEGEYFQLNSSCSTVLFTGTMYPMTGVRLQSSPGNLPPENVALQMTEEGQMRALTDGDEETDAVLSLVQTLLPQLQ